LTTFQKGLMVRTSIHKQRQKIQQMTQTPPNPKDRKNNYPLVNWIEADLNELAVGCKGGFKYNK